MVAEISYEDYKCFCNLLPSKDILYFVDNLFVEINNFIYCIKCKNTKDYENIDALFTLLENNKDLNRVNIEEFLIGFYSSETKDYVQEYFYKNKSFLVKLK